MVTANLNHERRPSSAVNFNDDETSNRQIQNRLDRLYLENPQYNNRSTMNQYQYSQRTLSPSNSRENMYMASNTVPVYRRGRKFYVSAEEYERMRLEDKRHRRSIMLKSQNLPVSKSHSINVRGPSMSLYNPIHRSSSHPHEHKYGVLKTPHLPVNNSITNNNNFNRYDSARQSRSTFRYFDERDDLSSITSTLPMRLPTTTTTAAIRSNSSDKVLDLQKTSQSSISSYNGYVPDDLELKRSVSAEIVQTTQPQVIPRRTIPSTTSDYKMSTVTAYPLTTTDQTYNQSNASKLTSYFSRIPPSTTSYIGVNSKYDVGMKESDSIYSVVNSPNRRTQNNDLTTVLSRPSTTNNSNNEYYYRDTTSGSFSDDNSSSLRQNPTDNYRYRRAQLVVETDDDYGQQNEVWSRSTARTHSNDGGLTEKKRVRFADMEGYTLETVPDIEQQQRTPMNDRLLVKRSYGPTTSHFPEQVQSYHNTFYQTTARVGGNGSKLATDV